MGIALCAVELSSVLAVGCAACRLPRNIDPDSPAQLHRPATRLVVDLDDITRRGEDWAADLHSGHAVLHRLHFRIAAGGDTSGERSADPRIIATTLLRDNPIRWIVALFVLTMAFTVGVLVRTEDRVPYLLLTVALVLSAASIAAFLYLIDHAARLLRPVSIVWRVGEEGLTVLGQVYPARIEGQHTLSPALPSPGPGKREVVYRGTSGIVLAVDLDRLRREAERTDGIIEFLHRVGDFVAVDEPIYRLHDGAGQADDDVLCAAVAFGPERTLEQDATFAFRVIVETSPSRRCRVPSTTRRRAYSPSTSSIGCCGQSAGGIFTTISSVTVPVS